MNQNISKELVEAGRRYESLFVPALFESWTKHLVDGADIKAGGHVLDIACGTGVLARKALSVVGAKGRVVGVDPAPGMIAVAGEIEPEIEWIECSAEALTFDDAAFDCVVSQFGVMFFQDRQKAASEIFRVLKPRGALAMAAWRSVDHNPAYKDIIDLLQAKVGAAAADALRLPFSLGNPEVVAGALERAGFSQIEVNARVEEARFPSVRQMVEAELRGWLPLFDIMLSEETVESVLAQSDRLLSKYTVETGEAAFPTAANIFTARKV